MSEGRSRTSSASIRCRARSGWRRCRRRRATRPRACSRRSRRPARIPREVNLIVHGTTATTNALLERKVARCGLITTKGFRDVLELGRRTRPHAYGMIGAFEPLISRDLRLEVSERLDATGKILTPLDEDGRARGRASPARHGCRGDRHPFPAFLHQSRPRGPRRRHRRGDVARGLRDDRPSHHLGVPRVRARRHRLGQCLGPARAAALPVAPAGGPRRARLPARLPGDAGQRRHGVVAQRHARRRADGDVGPGVGRHRLGLHLDGSGHSPTSSPTTWAAPRPTWR